MTYSLNNKLSVALFIDNIEYNLAYNNVLNFLHMGSSVTQQVPTIHFSITDTNSDILKTGIPDGIPIRVVLKTIDNSISKTYTFRKFHSTKQLQNGIYKYDVDGYWDSPLYWAGTACLGLQGNSNDVLAQIAALCGFKYLGTTTNDNQTWFQQNDTYGRFSKTIRKHGYVNDKSCMSLGLDLSNTLIYSDLNAAPNTSPTELVAYQQSDVALTVIDYHVVQASGFNNQMTGYSMGLVVQSLVPEVKQPASNVTPIDPVAIQGAATAISTNSSQLNTINNTLTSNLSSLSNNLQDASLTSSQTILNTLLSNNSNVVTATNSLNTSVAASLLVSSNLSNTVVAVINTSTQTFATSNASIQALTTPISNAQLLVNAIVDTPSLNAAIAAVTSVSKSTISASLALNPASVAATVSGSLVSAITNVIDNSSAASVYAMGSSAVTDVLAASSSANALVSNAVSLAASASSAAAASGIASATALTTSAMSSSSSGIASTLNAAIGSAVTSVEKLISDQVKALANIASTLPTFGSLSQGATSTPITSVVFTSDVKAPLLNTTVKSEAKRGAYSYSGVDSGNTHVTYDQANYQNTRYSNLFSLKLELLLNTQSEIQLLSQINFSVTDLDNQQSIAYSGLYTVISKAIYIQGVTYAEKLEVVRHGTNDTYVVG